MIESVSPEVGTLDEEIVRSEIAWGRLISAIGRVPIDRTEESGVCGAWSLKDLLAHITYWDAFEIDHIATRQTLGEIDWQSINEDHARLSADRIFADVLGDMEATHKRLMEHVATLPELDPALFRELTHDHYVEHGNQVADWIDRSSHGSSLEKQ
jgi:hypothetical protein